jgi:quercetin 2,3-dioxygenase
MHEVLMSLRTVKNISISKPRYQEVKSEEIPEVTEGDGSRIKVICGVYRGTAGPVEGIAADPLYLDVTVPSNSTAVIPVGAGKNVFAYVFEGSVKFCDADRPHSEAVNRSLVLFGEGDEIKAVSGTKGVRFLLAAGKPLKEPVAWYGPIVMNTQEELRQAYRELENGTFLK